MPFWIWFILAALIPLLTIGYFKYFWFVVNRRSCMVCKRKVADVGPRYYFGFGWARWKIWCLDHQDIALNSIKGKGVAIRDNKKLYDKKNQNVYPDH